MKKLKLYVATLSVALLLSTGCLATKLLIPGGEPLTVEESKTLGVVKDTVAVVTTGANNLLVPGGGGAAAIIAALGALYWRKKKRNG